jgi:hypothetical protein
MGVFVSCLVLPGFQDGCKLTTGENWFRAKDTDTKWNPECLVIILLSVDS